ncbi:MAG TPA: tRNA lysidine(34) synthetase TilS [Candidatus Saccharimonadales bacterium]|nr:tRNA lysidine(34) synthetase TilS [Candidatus Saccharimonadales bacterium]
MNVDIKPGKYVVAVSGGVDSMVLLDVLAGLPDLGLVVAHFEHGIRPDSHKDYRLVKAIAKKYRLPFVGAHGNLGPEASEAVARKARYDFLFDVMCEEDAAAVITAHHQDDMLETAIFNLLRGTGRLGLSSLMSRDKLIRPLLDYSKKEIREYADKHQLTWREDSTNADDRYLRNYIRHNIMTRFSEKARTELLERVRQAKAINAQIDSWLEKGLALQPSLDQLKRSWLMQLPYSVATEVMAAWLRRNGVGSFDRALIDYLVVAAKTKRPGKAADVNATYVLEIGKETLKLIRRQ